MSGTNSAPFSTITAAHTTPTVNSTVLSAKNLPDLVNKLQEVDPQLAEQLEGKALVSSKTPIGTFLVPAVVWVAAHYGLGWDVTICTYVAGALVLVGTYVMRYITTSPIAGLFHKGATPVQQIMVAQKTPDAMPPPGIGLPKPKP